MPTSKVSRGEGAKCGGLDGSAGSFPAQSLALALSYLFFPHYRCGLVFGVGATSGDLPHQKPRSLRLLSKRRTGGR
jgi:hypothetical protein